MRKKLVLFGLLALVSASLLHAREIDFDYFYDELSAYGEWIEFYPYGPVWSPAGVDDDWRPYTEGRWVYTDYGWTFESDEPWAWAVYHYGRWIRDDDFGWLWVPGTEWGPAWVAWRWDDDCIGWAPLPPSVGWSDGAGLVSSGIDFEVDIHWTCWIFVAPRKFVEPRLKIHLMHRDHNRDMIRRTKVVVRYPRINGKIFNDGCPVKDVERHWGKRIDRQIVVESDGHRRGPSEKGRLPFFRPKVKEWREKESRDLPEKRRRIEKSDPPDKRRPVETKVLPEKRRPSPPEESRRKPAPDDSRQKPEVQPPPRNDRLKDERPPADARKKTAVEKPREVKETRTKEKRVPEKVQNTEAEKLKKRPRR